MFLWKYSVTSLTALQSPLPRLKVFLSILMAGSPAWEEKKGEKGRKMPADTPRKTSLSGSQISTQGEELSKGGEGTGLSQSYICITRSHIFLNLEDCQG